MNSIFVFFRQSYRLTGFFILLSSYLVLSGSLSVMAPWPYKKRRLLSHLIQYHSRLTLKLLGVQVEIEGTIPPKSRGHLIVSNHLSYLDVLIISASLPCCFVTSIEIKKTPFLGLLTDLAACLYVERRSRENLLNEIKEVTDALSRNLSVCIFPEATSTNGEQVLRFRRPLYSAAVLSQKPVLPLCINYRFIDSKPVNKENRDIVCWYGDMSFFPHLIKLMRPKSIEITLHIDQEITADTQFDTSSLAETTHRIVQDRFLPLN